MKVAVVSLAFHTTTTLSEQVTDLIYTVVVTRSFDRINVI